MQNLVDMALSCGFTEAVWMDDLDLECEEKLRAYCNPEGCPNHGNNWVCPPGCGTIKDCAEKVSRFHQGILLRSVSDLTPPTERAEYKKLNQEHNLRLRDFIETLKDEAEILALTSGGCVFCDKCTFPKPCIKPDVRMNSLSAFGIDVGKLCEKAKLEYSFRKDRVYYVALVLIKNKA
jgi:predicted metal-binding protein